MKGAPQSPQDDLQIAVDEASIPARNDLIIWINKIKQLTEIKNKKITFRVVGVDESEALNEQFRGRAKPTNVLSFPAQLPEEIEPDYLGDIIICARVVAQEAAQQHKTLAAHWMHMLVHGVLHLKGYDHIQPEEAQEMEALEIRILATLGVANPYQSPG